VLLSLMLFHLLLGRAIVIARRATALAGFFQMPVKHEPGATDDGNDNNTINNDSHRERSF